MTSSNLIQKVPSPLTQNYKLLVRLVYILAAVSFIVGGIWIYKLTSNIVASSKQIIKMSEKVDAAQNTIRFDEILTNNLLLYTTTADPIYKEKYWQTTDEIKTEVRQIKAVIGIDEFQELFKRDSNAYFLIEHNKKAIELTDIGQKEEAYALLHKNKYTKAKTQYLKRFQTFLAKSESNYNRIIEEEERIIESSYTTLAIMLSIGALSIVIILFFSYYIRQFEVKSKELQLAKEEALRSVQIKKEFLANMSHEIRTPMNAVLGFSEVLLNTELDLNQKECTKNIYNSANNLLVVINDILDLSKIEAGKLKLEYSDFNLIELLNSVIELFKPMVKAKGLNLEQEISPLLPTTVYAAPDRISQVLINLINNALKFTDEGEICLSVYYSKDQKELVFEIKDSGIGIAPNKLESIFESFTQAENYTTRIYGGTGLGLSISKKLVQLMGGEISVKSKKGEGSKFYFSIPLQIPRETEDVLSIKKQQKIKSIHAKIMIVDDNAINRKLVAAHLKQLKAEFDFAVNGQEATLLHQQNTYDLILMDIQMPVMDGFSATTIIRQSDPNIPIIALTAHVLKEEMDNCILAGMNSYLSKPYKVKDLHQILKKYLKAEQLHFEK